MLARCNVNDIVLITQRASCTHTHTHTHGNYSRFRQLLYCLDGLDRNVREENAAQCEWFKKSTPHTCNFFFFSAVSVPCACAVCAAMWMCSWLWLEATVIAGKCIFLLRSRHSGRCNTYRINDRFLIEICLSSQFQHEFTWTWTRFSSLSCNST